MAAMACVTPIAALVVHPEKQQKPFQQQEELWEDLFTNPSHWWDNRHKKTNPKYPDFRHKATQQPLWVDNRQKPAWVESCLPDLLRIDEGNGNFSRFLSSEDTLLQKHCEEDDLDKALDALSRIHMPVAPSTYKLLLQTCTRWKARRHITEIQAHITQYAPADLCGPLGITLVVALSKCGAIEDAHRVSSGLRRRSILSWTSMISACVDCGRASEALELYRLMAADGLKPNSYTYVAIFKACGMLEDVELGRMLHAEARRRSFASGSFVGSALVSMYSKVGFIMEAEAVFSELLEHDIVTWTAMLSAYVEDGQVEKVLHLYRQMHQEGLNADQMVYMIALKACIILAEREEAMVVNEQPMKRITLEIGQAFHADAKKDGYLTDVLLSTTLLTMYGKCGATAKSEAVFGAIAQHDLVLCRAMLSAYVEMGQGEKALLLYAWMKEKRIPFDALTYVTALQACSVLGGRENADVLIGIPARVAVLKIGQAIVADVQLSRFASDPIIGTALVTMYGKCGTLQQAEAAFSALLRHDIVSWTAMLSAYVENGHAEKALQLFSIMQNKGVHPDLFTFMISFQACTILADKEVASLIEGRSRKIKALEIGRALLLDAGMNGFDSNANLNAYLVSMFGKCGAIKEAEEAFYKSPYCSLMSWNAMLLAYV